MELHDVDISDRVAPFFRCLFILTHDPTFGGKDI